MHRSSAVNRRTSWTWEVLASAMRPLEPSLQRLARQLHEDPETAFEEVRAAAACTSLLADRGFSVRGGEDWDLPTAFRAESGSGPLNVALIAEYDALPGLGHACGHNLIAAASLGAACLLADRADELGITVTVIGTPAEEGGGGKALLLDRGAFRGLHAAAMVHPGPRDCLEMATKAVSHLRITYTGRESHAAAQPDKGINALDAFVVAQNAIGLLRQHLPAGAMAHGIVTDGGKAPNVVPDRTVGRWYVRADTIEVLAEVESRIVGCFQAGAVATGCQVVIEHESPRYEEVASDPVLAELFARSSAAGGRPLVHEHPAGPCLTGSTDMGNVSRRLPAIHPVVALGDGTASIHERRFAALAGEAAAMDAVRHGAVALALTYAFAADDPDVRSRLTGEDEAR